MDALKDTLLLAARGDIFIRAQSHLVSAIRFVSQSDRQVVHGSWSAQILALIHASECFRMGPHGLKGHRAARSSSRLRCWLAVRQNESLIQIQRASDRSV